MSGIVTNYEMSMSIVVFSRTKSLLYVVLSGIVVQVVYCHEVSVTVCYALSGIVGGKLETPKTACP